MGRPKKTKVKVNNSDSLEHLMQETYNDACGQIKDAQNTINELTNSTEPEEVIDYTNIASQRTNALKVKDSAIKIKLELAKLQHDILKHNGNIDEAVHTVSNGEATIDDFASVRDMINAKTQADNEENEKGYSL